MKIVHALGWYFPENLGGTEVYVAGLCARLRALGHDVSVAAPQPGCSAPNIYEHEGVSVFRYPIPAEHTRDEAQGVIAARGAEVFHEWLDRLRPDVLHAHSLVTGLGLAELRAAKRTGARIVFTHHLPALGYICRLGSVMQWDREPCDGVAERRKCAACVLFTRGLPMAAANIAARLPPAPSRFFGAVPGRVGTLLGLPASIDRDRAHQAELMALVDHQVVLNETARRIIAANGWPTDRVVVNRLGTEHAAEVMKPSPHDAPTRGRVSIGYVGRFDRRKGLTELVSAVRSLPGADLSLEIRGPVRSSDEHALLAEIHRLAGDDARVRIGPPVARADVPRVLASFDVLCCPSTGFENGPTVALDAFAVGTPVIASRIGNLAELIADGVNGRLVTPGDVPSLAAALLDVVQRPEWTIDLWRSHLPAVRTLDQVAADYLALYAA